MKFRIKNYFDNDIIGRALTFVKENNPIDFFALFFHVIEVNDEKIELSSTTDNGVDVPEMWIGLANWKEDFKFQINVSDVEIDLLANDLVKNSKYSSYFTLNDMKQELRNHHKWLTLISKLMDGEDIGKTEDNSTEDDFEPFKIMVLLFDKGHYKRSEIELKTDKEKYMSAIGDRRHCWVHTAKEYMELLNGFKPIEKYVWTYIVVIPNRDFNNEE